MSHSSPSNRLHFSRTSERRTSDEKLTSQLEFIAQYATKHYSGWAYEIGTLKAYERAYAYCESEEVKQIFAKERDSEWLFSSWISFYRTRPASPNPDLAAVREHEQRQDIYERAASAGHNARFSTHPWIAKVDRMDVDIKTFVILKKEGEEESREKKETLPYDPSRPNDPSLYCAKCGRHGTNTFTVDGVCRHCGHHFRNDQEIDPLSDSDPIPLSSISHIKPGAYYSHLFGLDAQVRVLLSSVQAAADSDMSNRFHSLLYGPPGTGKTDILSSTYKLLQDLNISCLSIDCTSTTEAGMRKLLLDEDEILPEVILAEEIEKAAHSFKLLLGIMDDRGTISQLNYRRSASRKVPALVLASANDYEALVKMDSGALLSRFSNEIYCPRPDREILAKILEREIGKVKNGSLSWIEPSLVFCHDERGISDPRMIKRVCLCGKDRLLDGSYQRDLEITMRKQKGIGTGSSDKSESSRITKALNMELVK